MEGFEPQPSVLERRTRSDGERSRAAILDSAVRLATVNGLRGLSIGRLAEEIGMSKSGLYAHFGSKEELQLATVETAVGIFRAEVIDPTSVHSSPLARLEALCESFLSYVERPVFPGGCFFASAQREVAMIGGRVRDRLADLHASWLTLLERRAQQAQEAGELASDEDPPQLAFELEAMLKMANSAYLMNRQPEALERARRGIKRRLELAATK
jgi:AcrR family transcriptional regulator